MNYNERNMFEHNPFMNNDHNWPRNHPMDPRRLEEIKAKSIVDRLNNETTIELTREIEQNSFEMNWMQNNINNMLDDNSKLNKELTKYKNIFWEIKKCDNEKCEKWKVRNYHNNKRETCRTCYWTKYLLDNKYTNIYFAIDEATEWSKDYTCITTFQKSWKWLEIIDTKIIKPKKK